jgi:hypothetical protein
MPQEADQQTLASVDLRRGGYSLQEMRGSNDYKGTEKK